MKLMEMLDKIAAERKALREAWLKRLRGRSKYQPHQGKREMARRAARQS